jgi:hypothetical protein
MAVALDPVPGARQVALAAALVVPAEIRITAGALTAADNNGPSGRPGGLFHARADVIGAGRTVRVATG